MELYIGVDLGTSAVKCLLVDRRGTILRQASRDYPLELPQPGWSQQDPRDWVRGTLDALGELLDGADKAAVRGLGVGGQMHGLVALDAQGRVLRPAILWNDGRTQAQTDYLNTQVGRQVLTARTGNIAFAGFTAPKLLWMEENEPDLFAAINKIMLPKDYLVWYLTGVHASDPSDASGTLLYDVAHRRWSPEMLEVCHLREGQLPTVFESWERVGTLKPDIAQSLGLPQNVSVCAGAGDNAAAAVGCGVVGPDRCNISLGTSGTVFITSGHFTVDPQNALHAFAHADGGYHQMGCILSAASCNKWWMDLLEAEDYGREQAGISALGENSVYFLPYLMGERSPHNDVNARGGFVGLSMDTARPQMTQAVLEGVAFAIRDCVEAARAQGIAIAQSTLCGGGAKSPLWREILANVLSIPLTLPKTEQGPAYGAAALAAVAAGDFSDVTACCAAWVEAAQTTCPTPALAEKYDRQYRRWRELYPALRNFYQGGN